MLASDFLALCETAWPEANLRIAKILGHKMRTREGGIATTDGAGILHSCPYYVDESIDHRADADLAREVEDALFKLADEKDLTLHLTRPRIGLRAVFRLVELKEAGHETA